VVDGDTIQVEIDGATRSVRYIGIDCPESGPFAEMATAANASLVRGETLILEWDVSERDGYGRYLCYVFLADGTFVNAELVRMGYAKARAYTPDTRYQDLLEDMQTEAEAAGVGIWGPTPTPLPPNATPAPTSPPTGTPPPDATPDDAASLAALVYCISGPLFFLSTIVLGILLLRQSKESRAERQNRRREIQQLEERLNTLSSDALCDFRQRWFEEIIGADFRSELEVEIKFVYPFLRFLGYAVSDLHARVPLGVQVGRQRVAAEADWVAYAHGGPFLVVEAKAQHQELSRLVQEQARSYAYGLGAPIYVLTNGKSIHVYSRGVDKDARILAIDVRDIEKHWERIVQTVGKEGKWRATRTI